MQREKPICEFQAEINSSSFTQKDEGKATIRDIHNMDSSFPRHITSIVKADEVKTRDYWISNEKKYVFSSFSNLVQTK